MPTKLKLNLVARVDKNENFDVVVSPAASLVYTPDLNNVFRISFSSALRNPTLTDQYFNLNVGRAQLLGNISGYEGLVTPESFIDFLNSRDPDTLDIFNESSIQPERVRSIEVGYRGTLFEKLWIDAGYYYNWYNDFIGFKIGIDMDYNPVTNFVTRTRILRISTNATTQVTTQGFAIGGNYYIGNFLTLNANYSWNVLNKQTEEDPIIPAFNTPEHKFNLGLGGHGIPVRIGSTEKRGLGFNVNYKWVEGFLFEGSPQFTGRIPTYDLVDAQVNWNFESIGTTIKIGASNILDNQVFQTYGGPRVGRLGYISILYEGKANK